MFHKNANYTLYILVNLKDVDDGVKWNNVDNAYNGGTWLYFTTTKIPRGNICRDPFSIIFVKHKQLSPL